MIDTDKYEGHSKGDDEVDWRIVGDNFVMNGESPSWRFIAYVEPVNEGAPNVMGFSDADANLIADAPLLLEFYKRVKEIMDIDEILETSRVELIWMALQEMSA